MSSQEKTSASPGTDEQIRPTMMTAPLIFISHDSRDAELAETFSKLLSSVSAGVLKSFRSSDRKGAQGIEFGLEWYPELMQKLTAASDVVCLLTQRSLDRPWILYEAGVAKGKLNTPVYGIALGISLAQANTGPFAQFQNCDDHEDSITKLVVQLLRRIPNSEPDQDAVRMQVQSFKSKSAAVLATLGTPKDQKEKRVPPPDTGVVKLFEEVKLMFQDLTARLEGRLSVSTEPMRRRWMTKGGLILFDELGQRISTEKGDPVGLLLLSSVLRDDFPWLYELGMEAYRAAKGEDANADLAIHKFQRAVEVTLRGPWLEDIALSKTTYVFFREIAMMMERFVPGSVEHPPTIVRRRRTKPPE